MARMRTYLDFAQHQPRLYEAMFSMQSGLEFGPGNGLEPLGRAFAAIQEAFPGPDVTSAEVAWAMLHGLATLQLSRRLPSPGADARLEYSYRILSPQPDPGAVPTSPQDDLPAGR